LPNDTCDAGIDWDTFDTSGIMFPFDVAGKAQCTAVRGYSAGGGCTGWEAGSGHDFINFRARDFKGWSIPLVTHADYYVDFDYTTDYTNMKVRWSEPFYIQTYSTTQNTNNVLTDVESVMLRWPYNSYRYRYKITPGTSTSWLGAQGWTNQNVYDADQNLQTWYTGYTTTDTINSGGEQNRIRLAAAIRRRGRPIPPQTAVQPRHQREVEAYPTAGKNSRRRRTGSRTSDADDRFEGDNSDFPNADAIDKAGLTRNHPWAVSQIFREDNTLTTTYKKGEMKISLNPFNGIDWTALKEGNTNAWGDPLNYYAASDACAPTMCIMPCSRELSAPHYWSGGENTWGAFKYYSDPISTEVDGVAVSPLSMAEVLVAWQLDDDLSSPVDNNLADTERPSIEIPAGFYMILDVDATQVPRFEKIVVGCNAKLEFDVSKGVNIGIEADNILVFGELTIGTSVMPWPSNLLASLTLHGHISLSQTLVAGANTNFGSKVLAVLGHVSMVSDRAQASTWTTLAVATRAGASQITVDGNMLWGVGDELIVSSTDFPLYRSGSPTENGDADPSINTQLPNVEGRHDEYVTIDTIAFDSARSVTVITLVAGSGDRQNTLSQPRFVGTSARGDGSFVFMAAHVGLVHSAAGGIIVSAELDSDLEAGNDWYKGFGGHIVVTQERFNAPGENARVVSGSLNAYGVEFKDMGQHNSEHSAIYFAYNIRPTQAPSTNVIDSCSLQSWSMGIVMHNADAITITNTVISRTYDNGIEVDRTSDAVVLTDNLIVGNYRMPTDEFSASVCGFDDSCRFMPHAAVHIWNGYPAAVKGNVVAGSEDTGFVAHLLPDSCDSTNSIWDNNEAYGALIGFHLMPMKVADRTLGSCGELKGAKAWKNAHMGIHATDAVTDLQLRNCEVAGNFIGIELNFVRPPQGDEFNNNVRIFNTAIIGETGANSCNDPVCQTILQSDVMGYTCGSTLGSNFHRVGLVIPQWTNFAKTCGAAIEGIPVQASLSKCSDPRELVRMCQLPLDNRFGNLGKSVTAAMHHAELHLDGVSFANFKATCGTKSRALVHHPQQPDMTPDMYFRNMNWFAIDADSKYVLDDVSYMMMEGAACKYDCDAVEQMVIHDLDGTTMGERGTIFSGRNQKSRHRRDEFANHYLRQRRQDIWTEGLADKASCTYSIATGAYECEEVHDLVHGTFDVIDGDRSKRRIGPLRVHKYTNSQARNTTIYSQGPFPSGCACQKHFGQFSFYFEPGYTYDLHSFGSMPAQTRLTFPSTNANDKILLRIFYTSPFPISVFVDGKYVDNQTPADENVDAVPPSKNTDAGTNLLNPQERYLYVTVGGSKQEYKFIGTDSIQVNTKVQMSVEEFFGGAGDNAETLLITNFATLLGIPANRIKVACVHKPGCPCLTSGQDASSYCTAARDRRQAGLTFVLEVAPETDLTIAYSSATLAALLEAQKVEMVALLAQIEIALNLAQGLAEAMAAGGVIIESTFSVMPPISMGTLLFEFAKEVGGLPISNTTTIEVLIAAAVLLGKCNDIAGVDNSASTSFVCPTGALKVNPGTIYCASVGCNAPADTATCCDLVGKCDDISGDTTRIDFICPTGVLRADAGGTDCAVVGCNDAADKTTCCNLVSKCDDISGDADGTYDPFNCSSVGMQVKQNLGIFTCGEVGCTSRVDKDTCCDKLPARATGGLLSTLTNADESDFALLAAAGIKFVGGIYDTATAEAKAKLSDHTFAVATQIQGLFASGDESAIRSVLATLTPEEQVDVLAYLKEKAKVDGDEKGLAMIRLLENSAVPSRSDEQKDVEAVDDSSTETDEDVDKTLADIASDREQEAKITDERDGHTEDHDVEAAPSFLDDTISIKHDENHADDHHTDTNHDDTSNADASHVDTNQHANTNYAHNDHEYKGKTRTVAKAKSVGKAVKASKLQIRFIKSAHGSYVTPVTFIAYASLVTAAVVAFFLVVRQRANQHHGYLILTNDEAEPVEVKDH
jgi:hypothetical protein